MGVEIRQLPQRDDRARGPGTKSKLGPTTYTEGGVIYPTDQSLPGDHLPNNGEVMSDAEPDPSAKPAKAAKKK